MLKMVDGTGIIGLDMVCPLGGAVSPPQPPNFDKVEMEGIGSLMLPNSLKAPLERVELIGNSVQLTTTGINLLPYKVGSKINSFLGGNTAVFEEEGIEITIKSAFSSSDGDIYFLGNNKSGIEEGYSDKVKAGDYTILSNSKLCTFYVVVWRNGTSKIIINNSGEQMIHFTVLDGDKIRLFLRVKRSIGIEKVQIMLCKHTDVNLPYEPYTGLKPSPSPEYPQEIKSAGKWNEEKQKYEVDVKVTGKNLLDINDITSETPQWLEIPCLIKNNIYIKSNNSTVLVENNQARLIVCFKDGTSRVMYDNLMTNGLPFKANSENPITTIKVRGTHIKSGMYSDIQVEYGNEPTPYEPYTEQTLTLTSDRPITKWDKLVEQGGEYGWLYQSAAKEYIGDNSVELYDTGFYFKLSDKKIVNGEGYCKELKQYVHREENPCIAFNMSANIYAYTLNTQEIYGSTVSETKEYLKSHPLHLVYKTEATEFIPLSESEQTQLRNLHSYNGTTHVFVDSGEVPCGIKLTYRKEK